MGFSCGRLLHHLHVYTHISSHCCLGALSFLVDLGQRYFVGFYLRYILVLSLVWYGTDISDKGDLIKYECSRFL